jgi:hypothetical protein
VARPVCIDGDEPVDREEVERLTEEMASRFTAGPGRRHNAITKALGSLMRRGYSPALTKAVLITLNGVFHERDGASTTGDEAEGEILRSVESAVRNEYPSRVTTSHDRCTTHKPGPPINCKYGSLQRIKNFLCEFAPSTTFVNDQDVLYIAALVRYVQKRRRRGEGPVIRMTDGHVTVEAAKLASWLGYGWWKPWSASSVALLKAKYIDRPGKPARRLSLLKQVFKGRRGPGDRPGVPSEYLVTGLGRLLDAPVPYTARRS